LKLKRAQDEALICIKVSAGRRDRRSSGLAAVQLAAIQANACEHLVPQIVDLRVASFHSRAPALCSSGKGFAWIMRPLSNSIFRAASENRSCASTRGHGDGYGISIGSRKSRLASNTMPRFREGLGELHAFDERIL
jgi:hypothetical protein